MLRLVFLFAVASFMGACIDVSPAVPTHGALRIHGVPGQGELYLDAVPRGPVQTEQLFESLTAGVHLIDLRRDGVVAASMPVEVRAGMILDARIEAPPPVAAARPAPQPIRAVSVATAAEPAAEAVVAVPSAPPFVESGAEPHRAPPLVEAAPRSIPEVTPARTRPRSSGGARRGAPSTPPVAGREEALDALLEQALERGPAAREIAAHDASRADMVLPLHPSTSEISYAMQRLRGPLAACGGAAETAYVQVDVSGMTGRPQRVSVRGRLAGTPAGSCIERVVSGVAFSRFSRARHSFSWPIRF